MNSRHIPEGSQKIASKRSDAVAYLYSRKAASLEGGLRYFAIGYLGKSSKSAFHQAYGRHADQRIAHVAKWLSSQDAYAAQKAAALAEKKNKLAAPHGLKLGDVMSGSWGYDQTNVEFWQITKIVGRRMVEISKLQCETESTGWEQGKAVPLVGQFSSSEKVKRCVVDVNNRVKLYDFCSLSKAESVVVAGVEMGFAAQQWSSYA